MNYPTNTSIEVIIDLVSFHIERSIHLIDNCQYSGIKDNTKQTFEFLNVFTAAGAGCLVFILRQIFCTKENMRTISKSVSRYPGDVWSSAVEQSKHFQTDLVLLPEPEPKLGPVWCYNYKHETCHIITQSDIKHISTVVLMVCCNTILGLVEIAEILLF